jgi:hypothetical protein
MEAPAADAVLCAHHGGGAETQDRETTAETIPTESGEGEAFGPAWAESAAVTLRFLRALPRAHFAQIASDFERSATRVWGPIGFRVVRGDRANPSGISQSQSSEQQRHKDKGNGSKSSKSRSSKSKGKKSKRKKNKKHSSSGEGEDVRDGSPTKKRRRTGFGDNSAAQSQDVESGGGGVLVLERVRLLPELLDELARFHAREAARREYLEFFGGDHSVSAAAPPSATAEAAGFLTHPNLSAKPVPWRQQLARGNAVSAQASVGPPPPPARSTRVLGNLQQRRRAVVGASGPHSVELANGDHSESQPLVAGSSGQQQHQQQQQQQQLPVGQAQQQQQQQQQQQGQAQDGAPTQSPRSRRKGVPQRRTPASADGLGFFNQSAFRTLVGNDTLIDQLAHSAQAVMGQQLPPQQEQPVQNSSADDGASNREASLGLSLGMGGEDSVAVPDHLLDDILSTILTESEFDQEAMSSSGEDDEESEGSS